MKIIRKKLTPDELQVPNTRYDPDCDCVQQTYDNGTTWVDAPLQDPRTSLIYLRPALTGDAACDAATGIISNFQNGLTGTLSRIDEGANAVGVGNFIASVLLDLTGIGLLFSIILDFAALAISIGTTDIAAAFTSTVYDQFLCILFDNMDSDGQIDSGQFAAIQTAITSTFGGSSIENAVIQQWLLPLGFVGLSNLGVVFAESGDCSSCGNWCYTWDFTADAGIWEVYPTPPGRSGSLGVYVSGTGFEVQASTPGGANRDNSAVIRSTFTATFVIEIQMTYTAALGTASGLPQSLFALLSGSSVVDGGGTTMTGTNLVASLTVNDTIDEIVAQIWVCANSVGVTNGSGTITSVKVTGSGTNPFGADNC